MKTMKKFLTEIISVIMCISILQPIIVFAQTAKNEIVNADIYVNLSAYVPTISGTISCAEGKMVTLIINNITNNTVIANQTITAEMENQSISYTLPSLVSSKEYEVTVSCTENGNSLAYMSVILDSSIVAVSINGTATTADTVDVNASLQTTNTGLIDKNISFTGNKTLSTTIPNLLPSASFHLTAVGYETITTPDINVGSDDITAQLEKTGDRLIVTGNISLGEGKQLTILVTAPNGEIAYVDQIESGENGQYTFDFNLPLNAISGEYNVKVGGGGIHTPLTLSFMHMPETGLDTVDMEYEIIRNSNDEFRLVIGATNISSFIDKVYVLGYDTNAIIPTNYRGLQYDNSIELGLHNNINIISDTGGKIRFSIVNPAIPPDKVWNGLINVFEFKFISDIGGTTKILFYEE